MVIEMGKFDLTETNWFELLSDQNQVQQLMEMNQKTFAPQDTILTMDYPTIRPIVRLNGIDAIEKYYTDMSMFYYLKGDIENFVVELCAAEENQRLSRVVAL